MKIKLIASFLLITAVCILSACVSTVDGHMTPGVPFVKDTIESRYERPLPQIMAAAKEVLKRNGQLIGDNTITQTLEAKVNTRSVWVRFAEVDQRVTKVTVQARSKAGGADIDLASEIDKQIALQLTAAR